MKIAFYAPLKPPDHPIPSGDRTVARLWLALFAHLGHEVELACRLRTFDRGDPARIARLDRLARHVGERLATAIAEGRRARPDLWFTYHPYPKAPDHLGPRIAERFGLPLVVAEASLARRQAEGVFAARHALTRALLARADLVLAPSRRDLPALAPHVRPPARLVHLPPFLDTAPFAAARRLRAAHRARLARALGLPTDVPWLLAVAMMRPGAKARSWRFLAESLRHLQGHAWTLLVAGDGPCRDAVAASLGPFAPRLRWLGRLPPERLPALYAAADLLVWPGLGEAYGMVYLEAQASGLPVVALATHGVPEVVDPAAGNRLIARPEPAAFAAAVASLLDDAAGRRRRGAEAAARVEAHHGLAAAAARVAPLLDEACRIHRLRGP